MDDHRQQSSGEKDSALRACVAATMEKAVDMHVIKGDALEMINIQEALGKGL